MLQLQLSLLQDIGHHNARDQGQTNRHKEGEVKRLGCLLTLLEGVEHREWRGRHFILEVWLVRHSGQESLIHVLREQRLNILGGDVHKVGDVVGVVLGVGLVDLVRTVSVGVQWLVITLLEDSVVEIKVAVGILIPVGLESTASGIREVLRKLFKVEVIGV